MQAFPASTYPYVYSVGPPDLSLSPVPCPRVTRLLRLPCLLLILVLPVAAQAQWHASIEVDDRIEVRSRTGPRLLEGRFVRATTDSVWLRDGHTGFVVSLPRARIENVRIYRGSRRQIGRSAVRGLLVGAAIGAGLGFIGGLADDEFSEFFGGPLGGAAITGALLAAPGAVIGAMLGISVPVWERVPVETR